MSYRCDLFFTILFIFIIIDHTISLKQARLFFSDILFSSSQRFRLKVLLSFCLILSQFQPGVAYKSVAYKKKRADFQITFDNIDHNMLSEKLMENGFCDDTVNWFKSYLADEAFQYALIISLKFHVVYLMG